MLTNNANDSQSVPVTEQPNLLNNSYPPLIQKANTDEQHRCRCLEYTCDKLGTGLFLILFYGGRCCGCHCK